MRSSFGSGPNKSIIRRRQVLSSINNWVWGGGGASFNPLSLSPFFGFNKDAAFVSTVDNNITTGTQVGKILDSCTALTGQAMTNSGVTAGKAIFNGDSHYMKAGAQWLSGVAADYNFLHNGGDFDIFFSYYQITAAAGNTRAIINNNGFSNTARGMLLYYDNTGSTNTLKLRIGNGSSSVISRDIASAVTQEAINYFRINKTGNVVTVYKVTAGVETSIGTQTNTGWSASDAAAQMAYFSTTAATTSGCLYDMWIFNRSLSVSEAADMNTRVVPVSVITSISVDAIIGDSNTDGQAPNVGIDPVLNTTHNVLINKMATAIVASSDYIERLTLARNNKLLNATLTQHGVEMRLGYLYADPLITKAILKYGQGSTDSTAWSSGSEYTRWMNDIPAFIKEMKYSHRRSVTVDKIIVVHGANDCQAGEGGNYKTNITKLIKDSINAFVTAGATVNVKLFFPRTKSGGAGFDAAAYALVNAAQTDMGNGSIPTDEPTIAAYVRGSYGFSTEALATIDSVHFTTASYDSIAQTIVSNN